MFVFALKVGGLCFSRASEIEPSSQQLFTVSFGVRLRFSTRSNKFRFSLSLLTCRALICLTKMNLCEFFCVNYVN